MLRLLEIEWLKLRRYKAFWILLTLFFGFQILLFYGLDAFKLNLNGDQNGGGIDFSALKVFTHPNIWLYFSYVAGFFKIILAVLLVLVLNNEFEFKTYRQHIIDGLSRTQNFMLKVLLMFVFSILSYGMLLLMILIFGDLPDDTSFWEKGIFGVGFFLETLGFMSFTFMLSHFIKKTGLVIGLLLPYALGVEPYLNYKYPEVGSYLPLQLFSDYIQFPFINIITNTPQTTIPVGDLALGVVYIGVFLGIAYAWVLKKDQ